MILKCIPICVYLVAVWYTPW